jgi:outer membrane lipoprotein-sorting protein
MKQPFLISVALVAAVVQINAARAQAPEETPTAQALLQQMAAVYAGAQSYSDTTFVRYLEPDGGERFHVEFQIRFQRPSSIRLDAESRKEGALPRREVLWSNGATIRTWSSGKAVVAQAKVRIAKSGMFGTYAYHIPTLLEESYAETRRLHDLSSATLAGEENVEGVDCHRIQGDWDGDAYEVWIGKEDHLVRKIVAQHSDHRLEEIHRSVALNTEIAPEVFRFAPEEEVVPKPAAKPARQASPGRKR